MNDLKWADVAHMYAKADFKVRIKNRDCDETFLMVSHRNVGSSHFEEYVSDGVYWKAYGAQFSAWADHAPILRHLEDISEAEMLHLLDLKWRNLTADQRPKVLRVAFDRDRIAIFSQHFRHDNGKEYEKQTSMPLEWLGFECFHWLLYQGFDLFGLIEKGEAIQRPKD